MSNPPQFGATQLLEAVGRGDSRAAADLLPLIYQTLHALAQREMAREPGGGAGHTLQPTALVHEAYLRLIGPGNVGWDGRRHFYAAAATAMRRILVERARRRAAVKHGAGRTAEPLGEDALVWEPEAGSVLALDEALERLGTHEPRWSRIVELRYFAGLTLEQTAAAMDLSQTTIKDEWAFARAWLRRELTKGDPPGR